MNTTDKIYNDLVNDILENGIWDKDQDVRPKWADGTPAYSKGVIAKQLKFDCEETVIPTTKRVPWKTAIHEVLWFFVKKTSDCSYLDENNVKIWREWTNEENSIGTAYGYQASKKCRIDSIETLENGEIAVHKIDQIEHLIKQIRTNPSSRRLITSWWNIDDLDEMELPPCWWNTQWLVKEGKLHLIVGSRSGDVFLGMPFNIFQYYVLLRMMAQVTGYKVGTMTCNISDAHIYDRHMDVIQEQMKSDSYDAPELWINPDVKELSDFTIADFDLIGYQHGPTLKAEVAE